LRQLLTESFILAAFGAIAGLLVAHWTIPIFIGLLTPASNPASLVTAIDLRLLTFTCLLTLVTVLVCGLLPALRLANSDGASGALIGTGYRSRPIYPHNAKPPFRSLGLQPGKRGYRRADSSKSRRRQIFFSRME
jgi:hypothetical protein